MQSIFFEIKSRFTMKSIDCILGNLLQRNDVFSCKNVYVCLIAVLLMRNKICRQFEYLSKGEHLKTIAHSFYRMLTQLGHHVKWKKWFQNITHHSTQSHKRNKQKDVITIKEEQNNASVL